MYEEIVFRLSVVSDTDMEPLKIVEEREEVFISGIEIRVIVVPVQQRVQFAVADSCYIMLSAGFHESAGVFVISEPEYITSPQFRIEDGLVPVLCKSFGFHGCVMIDLEQINVGKERCVCSCDLEDWLFEV